MSGKERIVFGISLIINALLILALLFILTNQPNKATASSVAEVEITAVPATIIPLTQTPFIVTVIATSSEIIAEPTVEPTETAVFTPTPLPPVPTPTTAPPPSPTPVPIPVVDEPVYTGPDWLKYANQFRNQANLPFLVEDENMSEGAANHSYYMVLNDSVSHSESLGTSGYTDNGNDAGQNGSIAISGVAGVFYDWPMDYWISASFHAVPFLDPTLAFTGYGDHTDVNSNFGMAATMDVNSGLREDSSYDQYPITFPRDDGEIWVTAFHMPEFPDSATGCPGYQRPMGAPIIIILGDGDGTPQIYETRLSEGGNAIAHCTFDETNYYNPEAYWQEVGRTILNKRDAVVIIPRSPLKAGHEYTAYINNSGEEIEWSFTVVPHPLKNVVEETE